MENSEILSRLQHCVTTGDYSGLESIGLGRDDLPLLTSMPFSKLARIATSNLGEFVEQSRRTRSRAELQQALILHGAPRALMSRLFRMSSQKYCAMRRRLGLRGTGRPPTSFDGAMEANIWWAWIAMSDLDEPSSLAQDDFWLLVAKLAPCSLRSAHSLFQSWSCTPSALSQLRHARRLIAPKDIAAALDHLRAGRSHRFIEVLRDALDP